MHALQALLMPFCTETFLNYRWTQRMLHVPGVPTKWGALFTIADFRRIVQTISQEWPDELGLYAGGQREHHATSALVSRLLTRKDNIDLAPLHDRTLYARRVSRYHEPLRRLIIDLYNEIHEVAYINAYYSPPHSPSGLGPHYDAWDIFVVQIWGSKSWELWDGVESYPIQQCDISREKLPEDSVAELVITRPGDLLYLPRGMWHRATPTDEGSLHLTIGIHCKTGVDLVRWLGRETNAHAGLRRTLSRIPLDDPALSSLNREQDDLVHHLIDPDVRRSFALAEFAVDYADVFDLGNKRHATNPPALRAPHKLLEKPCAQLYRWNRDAVVRSLGDVTCVGVDGRVLQFEGSASRIWLCFEFPTSLLDAANVVSAEFRIPAELVIPDVRKFALELSALAFLCPE